ncbi:tripartite tricarboxylate transporter TctB family protein [Lonepinella koalarum]|uniref:tripartite tricarboxylate transporter TctB family protein n=1 Tax=Lonepinella koalarum TaxID=53417 RepID=UPI003F6E160A
MIRLLTPVILLIFGLIISGYSYYTYGDFSDYGAAFYPTIIGFLVAFFSLIDFVMELKLKGKYIFQHFDLVQDGKIILLLSGVVLFYLISSEYLGFVISVAIILNVLSMPFLTKNRVLVSLFLIMLSIGIYLLFAKVLLVGLPTGTLFE